MNILHNGALDIATGRSRLEKNWKNKKVDWSALVEMFKQTHRTAETYSEYVSSSKGRQAEIKDIGGFVGGYLSNGRRKPGNVLHRGLITLDIDFGPVDVWTDFTLLYENAAALYSTHKHSVDTPRYRLIMPMDRVVFADEYVAIVRRIAGILGIDYFESTTFRPYQLMYWPSTSKDGQFVFQYQDGPWICADDILSSYNNWQDSSEWPVSDREKKVIKNGMAKQGDPLEKPGMVGIFCRSYSITDAIGAFLPDVYDPCDVEDRFTFKEGSTAAGLVVYEDKYAYSHHGTDPVSNKLCNAFDLVRLHKFGLKDEDSVEGTPGNKLPSYSAMVEFASKDPRVRKQLGIERLEDARNDFLPVQQEAENDDWLGDLSMDKKGHYHSNINNVVTILTKDPALKGTLALNSFEHREIALRNLPWRIVTPATMYLTDKDDAGIRHYLEKTYDITGVQKIRDGVDIVLAQNSFHPVRDYLESLAWDGQFRLDELLIEYLGAENSEYVRAVTRKTLAAAVARIFKPGIKFDYTLVLVGKQGVGKSELIYRLGKQWYSDSFTTVQGKEAFEQVQGVWIVEIAELAGFKKAEMETIKHFISKRDDRYRVAYGRRVENFPRQCVFIPTTNDENFLKDPTGNRRFWPVKTQVGATGRDMFEEFTDDEVDQVWAEAVEAYRNGETLFLPPEIELEAFQKQMQHSEYDERTGMVQAYLETLVPPDWEDMDIYQRRSFLQGDELQEKGSVQRDKICIAEIWCEVLGGHQKEMNHFNTKPIHHIMQRMPGWIESPGNKKRFKIYGVQKAYVRSQSNGFGVATVATKDFVED
jgi:putative DNA primase/helicase